MAGMLTARRVTRMSAAMETRDGEGIGGGGLEEQAVDEAGAEETGEKTGADSDCSGTAA